MVPCWICDSLIGGRAAPDVDGAHAFDTSRQPAALHDLVAVTA